MGTSGRALQCRRLLCVSMKSATSTLVSTACAGAMRSSWSILLARIAPWKFAGNTQTASCSGHGQATGNRRLSLTPSHLVFYLDRWWWRGGWYPDYNIRLFRRDRATWGGTDPHEKILVDGKVRRLRNALHHFSYRDIEDHVQRINRFTSISSRELFNEQRPWRLGDALFRPAFRFFRSYILKRGFLEGFAGFYVALTAAVYVFLKYAKLWELELQRKNDGDRKRS
jgi:hypothetical protein